MKSNFFKSFALISLVTTSLTSHIAMAGDHTDDAIAWIQAVRTAPHSKSDLAYTDLAIEWLTFTKSKPGLDEEREEISSFKQRLHDSAVDAINFYEYGDQFQNVVDDGLTRHPNTLRGLCDYAFDISIVGHYNGLSDRRRAGNLRYSTYAEFIKPIEKAVNEGIYPAILFDEDRSASHTDGIYSYAAGLGLMLGDAFPIGQFFNPRASADGGRFTGTHGCFTHDTQHLRIFMNMFHNEKGHRVLDQMRKFLFDSGNGEEVMPETLEATHEVLHEAQHYNSQIAVPGKKDIHLEEADVYEKLATLGRAGKVMFIPNKQ